MGLRKENQDGSTFFQYKVCGRTIKSKPINLELRKRTYFFTLKISELLSNRFGKDKKKQLTEKDKMKVGEVLLDFLHNEKNLKELFDLFIESDMGWLNMNKLGADDKTYIEVMGFANQILGDFFGMTRKSLIK